jgi:hypothetical protein
MTDLRVEASAYREKKREETRQAARMVAFFLATGVDLDAALAGDAAAQRKTVMRLERLLERERLRGWARHWSYDLNRHIALKDALDQLRVAVSPDRVTPRPEPACRSWRPARKKKAAP